MAERIPVQCEACSHPYSARAVEGTVILPTDDGKCVCGGDEFVVVEGVSDDSGETVTERDAGPAL